MAKWLVNLNLQVTAIITTKYVKNWTLSGPGEERLPSLLSSDPSDRSDSRLYFVTVARIYLTLTLILNKTTQMIYVPWPLVFPQPLYEND